MPSTGDIVKLDELVLKSELQSLVHTCPPVGSTYTQYPPSTVNGTTYTPLEPYILYPGTSWIDISSGYDGAFFRALGGNSNDFGTIQDMMIQSHYHAIGNSGNHSHTVSGSTGEMSGDKYASFTPTGGANDYIGLSGRCLKQSSTSSGWIATPEPNQGGYVRLNIDLSHTHTFSNSCGTNLTGDHSHSCEPTGGTETRPKNYSIRIWFRTA